MTKAFEFWKESGLVLKIVMVVITLTIINFFAPALATILFLCIAGFGAIKWLWGDDDHQSVEAGFRRGARLVTAVQLKKMIEKSKLEVGVKIGGVPAPVAIENKHVLLVGGNGSGKSLIYHSFYNYARSKNQRAVVVDLNGVATAQHYRKGKDHILNPFDSRSEAWSPFAEIAGEYHIDSVTKSLVADGEGADKAWNGYAQNIVAAVLGSMLELGRTTNGEFYKKLILDSTADLAELVKGTPAQRDFEKLDTAKLNNTLSIISSQISSFKYLSKDADKNSFSIREWIQKDDDSWIFINVKDDQLDALKPLITAWLDVAISALLSSKPIDPNSDKRTWFMIDEMPSLGRIQSIDALLCKSRKFGGACVGSIQSTSSLNSLYGMYDATTLLGNFSSQVILRQNDSSTAEYFAKTLGAQEINRRVEGGSDGEKSTKSYSDQITQQQIVLASQLMTLPDRQGYLNLAGSYPVSKIEIAIPKSFDKVAEEFIPR